MRKPPALPWNIDALLAACKRGYAAKANSECPYKPGTEAAEYWHRWQAKRQRREAKKEKAA